MKNQKSEIPGPRTRSGFTCQITKSRKAGRSLNAETRRLATAAFCFLFSAFYFSAYAQGTAFTYQGRLDSSGTPYTGSAEFQPTLWNAASAGTKLADNNPAQLVVSVTNGLFVLPLDFGANFPGADRWLELEVRTGGGGAFSTLNPRQKLTATPYAITAQEVTSANLARLNVPNSAEAAAGHPVITSGFITAAVVDSPGSGYTSAPAVTVNANGPGSGAVITATISSGAVTALDVVNAGSGYTGSATLTIGAPPPNNYQVFVTSNFFPNVNIFSNPANVFVGDGAGLSNVWKAGGNAGANPAAGNFIGTTDNHPLELKVNGIRALRLEPSIYTPNVIGGSPSNFVAAGVFGATIAGGGLDFALINKVTADFGAVVGGRGNTASGYASTAMGDSSTASGNYSTAMGYLTTASGTWSTAMGSECIASGFYSTAMGVHTVAGASFSTAMGRRAKANHEGSFVWADSQVADFASSANNQFSIRAAGGIRLAGNVQLDTSTYRNLSLSGGNSLGYLYGSFPALNDGVHLAYNHYYNAAGSSQVFNTGGATSRLTVGYGFIGLYIGGVNGAPTQQRLLANSSGVTVNGTFNNSSDRDAKQDFAPVDPLQILDKVAQLPITQWSYKEAPATRHIGPTAQDFHAAFQIGTDDKHIAPLDEAGVALAAIQGLNQKIESGKQRAEIRSQKSEDRIQKLEADLKRRDAENAELKHELQDLKQLVQSMNQKLNGSAE